MRRLDRYIFAEILGPLALGFLVYTFILLLQALFKSAELIIRSGVAAATVGKLLLLSLPSIVVLTIPMALLLGILIAVGRLSSDSELVAIRSCGISLFSLYRPILVLSALLAAANTYLMIEVLPEGNHALQRLRVQILTQTLTEEVEPRIPHTGWQNKVLYVFEAPPGERRWKGTFLADAIPAQQNEVVIAEWGQAQADGDDEVLLVLENAANHIVDLSHPEDYRLVRHKVLEKKLPAFSSQATASVKRSLRELPFRELVARAEDPAYPRQTRNLARIEVHKIFGFPAACLVFGLLGLPLGFSSARGRRSSGFAISLGVILVYYVLLSSGENFAREGRVPPWLAIWLPNMALLSLGLFLLARRNRDKSVVLTDLDRWIRERFWSRLLGIRQQREARKAARRQTLLAVRRRQARLVLRVPEVRLRFPNSLDRYVLRIFFRILLLAFLTGTTIYVVSDLSRNIDDILKNDVSSQVLFDYYKFKCFAMIYEISPIVAMVTTLITFGLLSRTSELTAIKALGMSLFRLAVPVVLAAALVAGFSGLLQSEVLAASNERVSELDAAIKGREVPLRSMTSNRRWLYGQGNQLYNFAYYDAKRQELHRLQVFRFDDDYHLTDRLMVHRATYLEDGWWTFSSGWARSWKGSNETLRKFDEPLKYHLGESPEYFEGGLRRPEEMDYPELRAYISDLQASGQKVPTLEVELYNKLAYPLMSLVMALVALPFAFRLGRQGALYGIGLALVLGVALMIVLGVFKALGENAVLPPVVAVWSPGAIFAIFAIYLFLGVRS
jgi:LPS export ABC transporter permease LptG/LPS export ABC transporter permease LptF